MNQEIYCSVNSCHYWSRGNRCVANKIIITADSLADRTPDSIDAMQASTAPATAARNCMETCCKTYVTKGSGLIRADGIRRQ